MLEVPGLVTKSIEQPFQDAVVLAESAITDAGATIMARIDHSAAAETAGLRLRPTLLLLFGNPAGGTHVMEAMPSSAIDLPLKLLIVEDDEGDVWLACEEPGWIAARHGNADGVGKVVEAMQEMIRKTMSAFD